MSRWHIVIENEDGNIIGQFDVANLARKRKIHDNLPVDLSIQSEVEVPDEADLGSSLNALSDNVVDWDDRLNDL